MRVDGRVVKRTRVNHRIEGNVEQRLIQAHSRKLTQLRQPSFVRGSAPNSSQPAP